MTANTRNSDHHKSEDCALCTEVQRHLNRSTPHSSELEEIRKTIRMYVVALASSGDNFRVGNEGQAVSDKVIDDYVDSFARLIASERQKAVEELIDKASQVSVSTKYIAENPPPKGKSYAVIGVSMLKKLATNSNKGGQSEN